MNSELIYPVMTEEKQSNTPRESYLAMLEMRMASCQKHLSKVTSLAEAWDFELENSIRTCIFPAAAVCGCEFVIVTEEDLQELRPLLAVDRTELECDIARLRRQIGLLKAWKRKA